jgi:acyl-CoA reductase-like NAD-dependent aldehyde dehydrogenase
MRNRREFYNRVPSGDAAIAASDQGNPMPDDTLDPRTSIRLKDPSLLSQRCYVNGHWTHALSGATMNVNNPATGSRIGTAPWMGADDTRRAIDAAAAAYPGWRAKTAKERSAILRKWFEAMLANSDDLALILTSEQGKPLAESKGEIAIGAAYIEWFAEEAKRVYGDVIPTIANDRRLVVIKEPVGVCAAITPWNFPASMITRKVAPALAAGCTVVIKPAEATPVLGAGARGARSSARASRPACSTSSPATRRPSAARCARIRRCASFRSRARPRSAGS